MTKQNHIFRVRDIVEKAGVGMQTTRFAGGLRARPLEARADRDAGLIWFLTDVCGAKDDEIGAAGAAFEFAKARSTGERPDPGEKRKVTVPMR